MFNLGDRRLELKREKDQDNGIMNIDVRNLKPEAQIRNVSNLKSPEGAQYISEGQSPSNKG